MKKLLIMLCMAALITLPLIGCGGGSEEVQTSQPMEEDASGDETIQGNEDTELATFTQEELARYDGSGGNPAYVAVEGIVYDVSDSQYWPSGEHTPCGLDAVAGKDLSGVLDESPPRMRELIEKMPVVGVLEQ
ncbi:MAG: cytochrome b5 domain-containing protein [Actinomycetota bacterium]|nr:cytochrome b5 domain-containing protein [Actinomycetota bacterium]